MIVIEIQTATEGKSSEYRKFHSWWRHKNSEPWAQDSPRTISRKLGHDYCAGDSSKFRHFAQFPHRVILIKYYAWNAATTSKYCIIGYTSKMNHALAVTFWSVGALGSACVQTTESLMTRLDWKLRHYRTKLRDRKSLSLTRRLP